MLAAAYFEPALSKLVRLHTEAGLSYPRPAGKCPFCARKVVLCWGEKVKPYYRHSNKRKCGHATPGESDLHKQAKKILAAYFEMGGAISVVSGCKCCFRRYHEPLAVTQRVVLECQHNNARFDLALLNGEGEIVLGVEVLVTHRTTNLAPRADVTWIEVAATEVIAKLAGTSKKEVELTNLRIRSRCKHSLCLTNRELGIKLGLYYAIPVYSHPIRCYLDLITKGSCLAAKPEWRTPRHPLQTEQSRYYAAELARRGRCPRCFAEHIIRKGKFYCPECQPKVNANFTSLTRITVTEATLFSLLRQLSWIATLPAYFGGSVCRVCKRDYGTADVNLVYKEYWEPLTKRVEVTVLWSGELKSCCTPCLVKRAACNGEIKLAELRKEERK